MPAEEQHEARRAPPGTVTIPTPAGLVAAGSSRRLGGSVFGALFATVALHVAVLLLAPDQLTRQVPPFERQPVERLQVFLDEPEPPEEFVRTNPDVVSNPPDRTRIFSDRDQQAAQEEPADTGDPSLPQVEGEEPEPTQNIAETETVPPAEEVWEAPPGETGAEEAMAALPEQPIPGFEPVEEGVGLDVPVTEEAETGEDPVIGVDLGTGEREQQLAEAGAPGEETPRPRPRLMLPNYSHGPVGARQGSAPRVGTAAIDANFSEYGDYLTRMLDAIVRQWHLLAWESLQAGEVGTVVVVSFRIDAHGQVHGLEVENSTASLIATLICQDAISSRQPYGAWTPDMREVLGEEQTIRIRFLYR